MDQGTPEQILVIKLSALGDFVVSLGAMQAIRRHHRDARITLLELVSALADSGFDDDEVTATVAELVNSGRVALVGAYLNAQVQIS